MAEIPAKLGRYEIVKLLANGGMAQVLIARATGIEGFERHVVVKRIHADRADDPAFVQMFLDEARLSAALHHNNIVQVHDIGKEKGEYFFAMEYVHGQDLRMILREVSRRREKVPWEHVVTIMTNAAAGLHHAHELRGADRKPLGLVHRDVSPANILIAYDGTVKMVDFGIAKAAHRVGESTRAGTLKGKVAYLAPEQCAGKKIDRRSDVYALGVVLYELSTVRRLFKGDNEFQMMSAIVTGNIPSPLAARRDMPQGLVDIILKALSNKPAERYQTADEMREALEDLASKLNLRTSNGALATYMKQMFGAQPEPWLVDKDADLELNVDFDGSISGMAPASEQTPDALESMPNSPIARARRRSTAMPPIVEAAGSGAVKRSAPAMSAATPGFAAGTATLAATPSNVVTLATPPTARVATPPAGAPISTISKPATPPAGVPIAPAATAPAISKGAAKAPPTPAAAKHPTPPPMPVVKPVDADAETKPAKSAEPPPDSVAKPDAKPALEAAKPRPPTMDNSDSQVEESVSRDVLIEKPALAIAMPASEQVAAGPGKNKMIAGAALLAIVLVIFLATRGGGGSETKPPKPPDPTPAMVDPPKPPPEPEPVVEPDAAIAAEPDASKAAGSNTVPVTAGSGSGTNPVTAGSGAVKAGSAAGSGSAPKKKKKKWNPDELFIK